MEGFFLGRFQTVSDFFQSQQFNYHDLKNLFSWDYWVESGLPAQTTYFAATAIFTILLVIGIIYWRVRIKKANAVAPIYDAPINQLANIIVFTIIMSLSYWFFRAQAISYLSSRLVILASLIVVAGWLGWVGYYLWRIAPVKSRGYLERERFFRYIPKKKEPVSKRK